MAQIGDDGALDWLICSLASLIVEGKYHIIDMWKWVKIRRGWRIEIAW